MVNFNLFFKIVSVYFLSRKNRISRVIYSVFIILFSSNTYAVMPSNVEYSKKGFVWSEIFTNTEPWFASKNQTPMKTRWSSFSYTPNATWGPTSDGLAYGFYIGQDIVIGFTGTNITECSGCSPPESVRTTYFKAAMPYMNVNIKGAAFYPDPGIANTWWGSGVTTTWGERSYRNIMNLEAFLYIGPNAVRGVYTIPNDLVVNGIYYQHVTVADAGTVINYNPAVVECVILAPPTVDFGQVNLNGIPNNALLASKVQGIDISCTADAESAVAEQMNISFTGDYSDTYWGRLSVKNSSGVSMGYIRGRYLDTGGLCAGDTENEVGFDGTSGTKKINNVGVGTTHIPITWSLCSNGSGLLGDGSAQATVNIDWN